MRDLLSLWPSARGLWPSPLGQSPSSPGLVVLTGQDACLTVGLLLALRGTATGRPLLVVDGANAFDPYLIADLARRQDLEPQCLLERICISRIFTCYQLEALLEERLPHLRDRLAPSGLFLSGPLEPLLDEELPREEAERVFRRILSALDRVLQWPWTVVAACPDSSRPPPGREHFLPQVKRRARLLLRVTVEGEGWRIDAGAGGPPGCGSP
ncbi:MAG: hypothetical protein QN152_07735 [Armatimonadota bacterium]|nr:hypothetical protein [Armatimonadota bacterium]MDR7426886.1 hypothetical protein [Armatimonadota bacterium]MDR7464082.1 hypothetical protein [Armatimonadota bacterium]MDR7470904.1 hypothetical protein [Armatimonadota bacterium]MDR7473646.1 hypothetical protein [Armatimonadota bacterium]